MFVFAVTQLSHSLVEHLTLGGALQTLFLLLAVWWVWMYTCWFTNWIDPDKPSVRMLMFVLMLAGLLMSAAIPNAFGHEGAAVRDRLRVHPGGAVGVHAVRARAATTRSTIATFSASPRWLVVSAVFWIAGGIAGGYERVAAWVVRARARNRRAVRRATSCRASAARTPPTGKWTARTWPSAARCSSSSRSANPSS